MIQGHQQGEKWWMKVESNLGIVSTNPSPHFLLDPESKSRCKQA